MAETIAGDDKPTCFIIMPISMPPHLEAKYSDGSEHFEHVLEALFVPAVEDAGFKAQKPRFVGSNVIQAEIIRHLTDAQLVLCDMSALNPNVFFELGVRTALNRPVAMVRDQHAKDIPFDVGTISAHTYDGSLSGWHLDDERRQLAQHLRDTAKTTDANQLWKHFGIPQVAHDPPEISGLEGIELTLRHLVRTVDRLEKDRAYADNYVDIQAPIPESALRSFRQFKVVLDIINGPPLGTLHVLYSSGASETIRRSLVHARDQVAQEFGIEVFLHEVDIARYEPNADPRRWIVPGTDSVVGSRRELR